jgi:hypothetical protein
MYVIQAALPALRFLIPVAMALLMRWITEKFVMILLAQLQAMVVRLANHALIVWLV